ncbi:MAG TPA: methyltransferase domain-containing protein [Longimicrobiales bacterium]
MTRAADSIRGLYERHARDYDRDRGRSLQEKAWLDRFLDHVRPAGTILDLGCGMGEPIGRYILERGFDVVGLDASPSLIGICRARFPGRAWIVADMRRPAVRRKFDGVLAWDSFFHLRADDQRAMFPVFAAHATPGAPLMFTSGSAAGESIGAWRDEPLYHASLDPAEYRALLSASGFTTIAYCSDDPECGGHTVWLATFDRNGAGD